MSGDGSSIVFTPFNSGSEGETSQTVSFFPEILMDFYSFPFLSVFLETGIFLK